MHTRYLGALLCSLPLIAYAADWVTVAQATDGTQYAIDRESLKVIAQKEGLIEAWDKATYAQPRRWGPRATRLFNNSRRLLLHDCNRHRTEVSQFRVMYDEWPVAQPTELPRWLTDPLDIAPGSAGEAIHRKVCELATEPQRP